MPNFTFTPLLKITKLSIACILCFLTLSTLAQDKTKTIGNKPRAGSSNNSFDVKKGGEVGVKMSAGHKFVQLLKLNFDVNNPTADDIEFKVNVYKRDGKWPGEQLTDKYIKGIIHSNQKKATQLVSVDLSSYNIQVKGDIVVAVEWLNTQPGHSPGFSCGLLNGGTLYRESDGTQWKNIPVVGADFNVVVRKL